MNPMWIIFLEKATTFMNLSLVSLFISCGKNLKPDKINPTCLERIIEIMDHSLLCKYILMLELTMLAFVSSRSDHS
jgi:hypothetical protein